MSDALTSRRRERLALATLEEFADDGCQCPLCPLAVAIRDVPAGTDLPEGDLDLDDDGDAKSPLDKVALALDYYGI